MDEFCLGLFSSHAVMCRGVKERLAMKTHTPQSFLPGHSRSQENTVPRPRRALREAATCTLPAHREEGIEVSSAFSSLPGSIPVVREAHERADPGWASLEPRRPGGLRAAQLCGDSRPGLGSGLSESQEPWSGRALRAPLQPQSGLKSIFHSTAPKSPCAPTPFRPPWARWRGGG